MGDIDSEVSWQHRLKLERMVDVVQQLSLARDLERIAQIVRHDVRELTGADGISFILREGELCHYFDEEAVSPLWKGQRFPMAACVSGWAMENRKPVVVEDIYTDPRVPAEAYQPTFVKSVLMVPIRSAAPLGAIGCYWARKHTPTEEEIHLLQALADSTAVAMENVLLYASLEQRVRERTQALEREIVERRQAERARQESERRLALALEASGSAVWEMEVASSLVRGSDRLYTMLGYVPGDLATLADWNALVHEDDYAGLNAILDDLIHGRQDKYNFEYRVRAKDGQWHWLLCQAVAAERDETGLATRLVGTRLDITERRTAQTAIQSLNAELEKRVQKRTAELERANEALLRSNMELQRFAHATAHDLQTPLRSIGSFAQLVQQEVQGRVDQRVDEWLSLVIRNTRRLHGLIQDLLAYSRMEAQGLPLKPIDLRDVADEVVASLGRLIRETGAEVSCGHLPTLAVDRVQIAQVLQNLVENGIKYNRSKPPKIAIAASRGDEEWVFSVTDNGIGIEPRHHERIFDIFRRLHSYRQVPGAGIGLALCRRIVERHGGRIWVESNPGEGSAFRFTLPAQKPQG